MHWNIYLPLIAYFIIVFIIGYISSKHESNDDFLIAWRKLNGITIALTIAASFIWWNTLVNFTWFVYTYWAAMMRAMLWTIIWFIVIIPMAKKMRKFTEENKFYTLSDYISLRYWKHTWLIATIIITIWFSLSLVVQFIAGATVIQSISEISYIYSILSMGWIVLIYVLMWWFKAVVKTDIFQYILFLILFIIVIFAISQWKNLQLESFIDFKEVWFARLFAFFIIAMWFVMVSPELWQRVFAGRDQKQTVRWLWVTSILILIVAFCIGILWLVVKNSFPNIAPEKTAILWLSTLLPTALKWLGLVLFFAVIMSTIDTLLFVLANNFSRDIVYRFLDNKSNQVKNTKIWIIIFTIIPILIAIFYKDILTLWLSFISIWLSFAPILIGSFYFKLKSNAVKLALISALSSVFILILLGIVRPETSIISLPVSLIFLIIGQIIFKKNKEKNLEINQTQ